MKLYCAPGGCSLAAHITALEAGIAFDLQLMSWGSFKASDGRPYSEVNPKGKVPALALDEGGVLTELTAVLQYLADGKPESGLLPAVGSLARYRVLEWLAFINSEVHKLFGTLLRLDTDEAEKTRARASALNQLAFIDKLLTGQRFAIGQQFTVADPYIFVVLNWAQRAQLDLGAWPALGAHLKEVASRPAVQEALKAEGLIP
jgi:glutathione S-transferase